MSSLVISEDIAKKLSQIDFHHYHSLILKEKFHAQEGDFCQHCEKAILYGSSVYTCNNATKYTDCAFKLHKYCALPMTYMHPKHEHILSLASTSYPQFCRVCWRTKLRSAYFCQQCNGFTICSKCAIPLQEDGSRLGSIQHWSHQHPLRLLQRYSTFECDGCNKVATDFSYLCDRCSFWIHQSCALLQDYELFGVHHKHPLRLSDSLPQVYRKFPQFCKICNLEVNPTRWLYYCANCRFFAHIHCALSKTQVLRHEEDDPKLIHLPAPDELSLNSMMQKCIKDMISFSENRGIAPSWEPLRYDNHWAHEHPPTLKSKPLRYDNHWAHEHPLTLKSRSALITTDDGLDPELSERLTTCRCCRRPISTFSDDTDVFYECNQCNYSLHKYCAQFPKEIHHPSGLFKGFHGGVFLCDCCHVYSNGFRMDLMYRQPKVSLDIWCASLPEKIKHQAHHHPLEQKKYFRQIWKDPMICQACRCLMMYSTYNETIVFGCSSCDFYVHRNCALQLGTMTHRWDPHPLRLVLSLEDDVEDHPQEFECEFCSKEIDTNGWFYHCNICDLSFHIGDCITACSLDVKVLHSSKDHGSSSYVKGA